MMLQIMSRHMVKWLCFAIASTVLAMCLRSWVQTINLKKVFFSRSPPDIKHEPSSLSLFAFTFHQHCIQTTEWLRNQRFNWADSGGLYLPPRNPYGLHWTPVDSSAQSARPNWMVQCPVHWSPVQSSPLDSHWTASHFSESSHSPVD